MARALLYNPSINRPSRGVPTSFGTMTAIAALANSATVGAITDRISDLDIRAQDYEIAVKFTMSAVSPGNDKAVYVYLVPWNTTDDGTSWFSSSMGTATLPPSTNGAATIAVPNNLRLLGILNYTTISMTLQDTFLLSNAFGSFMPDGFSILVVNFSAAAITGATIHYTAINSKIQ